MEQLFDMGRHGHFIWISWGVVAAALLVLAYASYQKEKRAAKAVDAMKQDRYSETEGDGA